MLLSQLLLRAGVGAIVGYSTAEGLFFGAAKLFATRLRDGVKDGTVFRVYPTTRYKQLLEEGIAVKGAAISTVNWKTHEVLRFELNDSGQTVMFAYPKTIRPAPLDDRHLRFAAKSMYKHLGMGFDDDNVTNAKTLIGLLSEEDVVSHPAHAANEPVVDLTATSEATHPIGAQAAAAVADTSSVTVQTPSASTTVTGTPGSEVRVDLDASAGGHAEGAHVAVATPPGAPVNVTVGVTADGGTHVETAAGPGQGPLVVDIKGVTNTDVPPAAKS